MQASVHYYNVIGNIERGVVTGNPQFIGSVLGSTAPAPQSQVLAFNAVYGFDSGPNGSVGMHTAMNGAAIYAHQRGLAIIQNIFERIGTSGVAPVSTMVTSSGGESNKNVIIWNNTMVS